MNTIRVNKNKNQGLTLLELILSLLIFILIIFSSINITNFVLNRTSYVRERNEQLFNANLAMNTIVAHVDRADTISLNTTFNNTLIRLTVINIDFPMNSNIDFRNNTLIFGNNVMARYIEDIVIELYGHLMNVFIMTEKVIITRAIDIRHLEIIR